MGLFSRLSGKKKAPAEPNGDKPTAAVFVDFEHWFIAMNNMYHVKPDYKAWLADLNKRVNVEEIVFFADFSHANLSQEIPRIREFTNRIIETKNADPRYKKDFTDFIMLDSIYQKAMFDKNIDTFVIFTGDAHFSSVVSFLVNRCNRKVGVYGVKDSFSQQLKNTASWFVEVTKPEKVDPNNEYYTMLFSSLANAENKHRNGAKPTFQKTVKVVADYHKIPKETIQKSLEKMIEEQYIIRERTGKSKPSDPLSVNWKRCAKNPLFTEAVQAHKK